MRLRAPTLVEVLAPEGLRRRLAGLCAVDFLVATELFLVDLFVAWLFFAAGLFAVALFPAFLAAAFFVFAEGFVAARFRVTVVLILVPL